MNYLKQAQGILTMSVESDVSDNKTIMGTSIAQAAALIALTETQAEALEEQRKMNGMLLALLTQKNVLDLLKIGSTLDDKPTEHLDNFTEHARPFPAGDDWPRSCGEG